VSLRTLGDWVGDWRRAVHKEHGYRPAPGAASSETLDDLLTAMGKAGLMSAVIVEKGGPVAVVLPGGKVEMAEALVTLNPQDDGRMAIAATHKGYGWDVIVGRRLAVLDEEVK
jgi:hypothetical protein